MKVLMLQSEEAEILIFLYVAQQSAENIVYFITHINNYSFETYNQNMVHSYTPKMHTLHSIYRKV